MASPINYQLPIVCYAPRKSRLPDPKIQELKRISESAWQTFGVQNPDKRRAKPPLLRSSTVVYG